tara:strand:+ start:729 stop:878 length:150 start_codon:yes stop_codon:yes gene_type:complete
MKYTVTVKGDNGITLKWEIDADNAGTALQVAAAREKALSDMDKFIKRPS